MISMKKFKPKKVLAYALIGAMLLFILVLTWIPIVFSPEKLGAETWITNTLISLGILICSIILGEILGEDKQKEKEGGLYQIALAKFNKVLNELIEKGFVIYFSQFYIWYKARELVKKKEGFLVDHGFDIQVAHYIIKYVERDDLEEMTKGVFVKHIEEENIDVKFKKINEEELEVLKTIFSPNFVIDAPEYTYYLSAFGDSSSVSILEQAKILEAKERANKTFNRIFKVGLSLFISIIFGMATIQELTSNGAKQALVNTTTRIIALIGGLFSGFVTAVISVKLASQKLENKEQVLTFAKLHFEKKEFVPKSYEELVEEEIKEEEALATEEKESEERENTLPELEQASALEQPTTDEGIAQ